MNRLRTSALNAVVTTITFVIAVLLLTGPVFAHDPLHKDEAAQHIAHDNKPAIRSESAVDLAAVRALVITFRENGDDSSLDEAWQILAPAIETVPAHRDVLVTAAFVAQSRHEFGYALRLLEQALAVNRSNDEAWLLSASINLVRGNAEAAAAACGELRSVPLLVRITCNARVAVANGQYREPLTRLRRVLTVTDAEYVPAEMLAWSYSVAGDLAVGDGDAQAAEDLYGQSLALAERTQVRAALVDVHISEANYERAWQILNAEQQSLPLLVRRLIVARQLKIIHKLQPQLVRVQREFENWIGNEDWLHAREMARFYIDVVSQPDLARQLALINLETQREPEDLRLEERTRSRSTKS